MFLGLEEMPKRKTKIKFVDGFTPPDENEVKEALGSFPCDGLMAKKMKRRNEVLLRVDGGNTTLKSLQQCDEISLFHDKCQRGKKWWNPLPSPMDESAWLAKVNEEGQTFEQYASFVTLRSGSFKPNTNYDRPKIYILPIIDKDDNSWPEHGPSLQGLSAWMTAFFCRDTEILDMAFLQPQIQEGTRKRKAKDKILWQEPGGDGRGNRLVGRICEESGRYQTHVDGLLTQLCTIRENEEYNGRNLSDAFAVVGVTMCDLYSCDEDLFVAGMAAGGSKVAVLSFARYHPMLKMSPEKWQDYGYIKKSSNYSYYEDNRPRPTTTPVPLNRNDLPQNVQSEYFHRAGKLLIHEMCHVYGIDHCIHYHCLMNGTAHLVEDFSSPCHICCVCLRKLHFRLGFDIIHRYEKLEQVYKSHGLTEQRKWVARKLDSLGEKNEELVIDVTDYIDLTSD